MRDMHCGRMVKGAGLLRLWDTPCAGSKAMRAVLSRKLASNTSCQDMAN